MRAIVHLLLHALVPAVASRWPWLAGRKTTLNAWLWLMATMIVDADHLLATPVFAPDRCSITTHPLHHPVLWLVYAVLLRWPATRLVGAGLLIHMGLDALDCVLMGSPPWEGLL